MEKNGEFKPENETKAQKENQKVIEKTANTLYVAPAESSVKYFKTNVTNVDFGLGGDK